MPFDDKGLQDACLQGGMAIFASPESCNTAPGTEERINESLVYLGCTGSATRAGDRNVVFDVTTGQGVRWVLNVGYSFERRQYSISVSPYSMKR